MSGPRVRFELQGRIGRLMFVSPERRNAFDLAFCKSFAEASLECAASGAAVVLITAEGQYFSVGGDLDDLISHRDEVEAHVFMMASYYHVGIGALYRCDAPVVVAARGMVGGGAVGLLFGADMVIGAPSLKICAAATRSGLSPDGGSTWSLPRLVGRQRAFDILATNPTLTIDDARELGLVSRVLPEEGFHDACLAVTEELAKLPGDVLQSLKRLLRDSADVSFEAQLASEARAIARSAGQPDTLASLDAFVARRMR